jgi:hypothetical protein
MFSKLKTRAGLLITLALLFSALSATAQNLANNYTLSGPIFMGVADAAHANFIVAGQYYGSVAVRSSDYAILFAGDKHDSYFKTETGGNPTPPVFNTDFYITIDNGPIQPVSNFFEYSDGDGPLAPGSPPSFHQNGQYYVAINVGGSSATPHTLAFGVGDTFYGDNAGQLKFEVQQAFPNGTLNTPEPGVNAMLFALAITGLTTIRNIRRRKRG